MRAWEMERPQGKVTRDVQSSYGPLMNEVFQCILIRKGSSPKL